MQIVSKDLRYDESYPFISRYVHAVSLGVVILLLCFSLSVVAQADTNTLTSKEIATTLDSIGRKLNSNYVFPEMATKMNALLTTNFKNGTYSAIQNPNELATRLTNDLRETSKDKHLMVVYNPAIIARENNLTAQDRAKEEAEGNKQWIEEIKSNNYGFGEVKVLYGNIGYLDLREFIDPKYSAATLTNAMRQLKNADAIIVDLRQNDGGSPDMVQLIASYFFTAQPVHLANYYNRPKNELTESWTQSSVPGDRKPETPLCILTSSKTFSAAEAFSYELQQLKRATIIGERTAGGAHLTGSVIATDKFYVRIPQGRTTSPVTNSNWEGVGVTPDIEVSAENALSTAHSRILEQLKKK